MSTVRVLCWVEGGQDIFSTDVSFKDVQRFAMGQVRKGMGFTFRWTDLSGKYLIRTYTDRDGENSHSKTIAYIEDKKVREKVVICEECGKSIQIHHHEYNCSKKAG